MFVIYFIQSKRNQKVYVGMTSKDPKDRLSEHNAGKNEWTKHNVPFEMVYYESYVCKEDARKRELFYKSGIGKKVKKAIIEAFRG